MEIRIRQEVKIANNDQTRYKDIDYPTFLIFVKIYKLPDM